MCFYLSLKAARLQINANFYENFENVIKSIILYINQKEAIYTLSMALTTHVTKRGQNMQKVPTLR
jgi:Asp-tRNA(Asn)/Glu-tRNA(Gln) amidotransferase C subunit